MRLLFPCLCVILASCTDGINRNGRIAGKVTIDGETVSAGEVRVFGSDGIHSMVGKIRLDGSYEVKEPPLGPCKILVVTSTFKDIPPKSKARGPVDYTDPATGEWPVYVATPAKYESLETTDLQFEIKKGENKFDLELRK